MNNLMLKDHHWMEKLLQTTCDGFVEKIKRNINPETGTAVVNLKNELYLWSGYCN